MFNFNKNWTSFAKNQNQYHIDIKLCDTLTGNGIKKTNSFGWKPKFFALSLFRACLQEPEQKQKKPRNKIWAFIQNTIKKDIL